MSRTLTGHSWVLAQGWPLNGILHLLSAGGGGGAADLPRMLLPAPQPGWGFSCLNSGLQPCLQMEISWAYLLGIMVGKIILPDTIQLLAWTVQLMIVTVLWHLVLLELTIIEVSCLALFQQGIKVVLSPVLGAHPIFTLFLQLCCELWEGID